MGDRWWVRIGGGEVRGPWPTADVAEGMRSGRLPLSIEVSRDQVTWAPVAELRAQWEAEAAPPSPLVLIGGSFIIACLLLVTYLDFTRQRSRAPDAPTAAALAARREAATRAFVAALGGVSRVTVPSLSIGESCWSAASGHGLDPAPQVAECVRVQWRNHASELTRVRAAAASTAELQGRLSALVAAEDRRSAAVARVADHFAHAGDALDAERRGRTWEDYLADSRHSAARRMRELERALDAPTAEVAAWVSSMDAILNRDLRCVEAASRAQMNCAFSRVVQILDGRGGASVRVLLASAASLPPWPGSSAPTPAVDPAQVAATAADGALTTRVEPTATTPPPPRARGQRHGRRSHH